MEETKEVGEIDDDDDETPEDDAPESELHPVFAAYLKAMKAAPKDAVDDIEDEIELESDEVRGLVNCKSQEANCIAGRGSCVR